MAKSRIALSKDGKELKALRQDIESEIGRALKTSNDFVFLSGAILAKTHEYLSINTLKRIWNYISDENIPSLNTLNLLSRFLGYTDWDAFLNNLEHTATSQAFIGDGIRCDTLEEGDQVVLTWRPNRRLVVRYTGDNSFVVVDSQNSKLLAGDTFKCIYFIEQQPLFIDELMHQGFEKPMSYICGKQGGIHVERI